MIQLFDRGENRTPYQLLRRLTSSPFLSRLKERCPNKFFILIGHRRVCLFKKGFTVYYMSY